MANSLNLFDKRHTLRASAYSPSQKKSLKRSSELFKNPEKPKEDIKFDDGELDMAHFELRSKNYAKKHGASTPFPTEITSLDMLDGNLLEETLMKRIEMHQQNAEREKRLTLTPTDVEQPLEMKNQNFLKLRNANELMEYYLCKQKNLSTCFHPALPPVISAKQRRQIIYVDRSAMVDEYARDSLSVKTLKLSLMKKNKIRNSN